LAAIITPIFMAGVIGATTAVVPGRFSCPFMIVGAPVAYFVWLRFAQSNRLVE
jgi:hypothetical protein